MRPSKPALALTPTTHPSPLICVARFFRWGVPLGKGAEGPSRYWNLLCYHHATLMRPQPQEDSISQGIPRGATVPGRAGQAGESAPSFHPPCGVPGQGGAPVNEPCWLTGYGFYAQKDHLGSDSTSGNVLMASSTPYTPFWNSTETLTLSGFGLSLYPSPSLSFPSRSACPGGTASPPLPVHDPITLCFCEVVTSGLKQPARHSMLEGDHWDKAICH